MKILLLIAFFPLTVFAERSNVIALREANATVIATCYPLLDQPAEALGCYSSVMRPLIAPIQQWYDSRTNIPAPNQQIMREAIGALEQTNAEFIEAFVRKARGRGQWPQTMTTETYQHHPMCSELRMWTLKGDTCKTIDHRFDYQCYVEANELLLNITGRHGFPATDYADDFWYHCTLLNHEAQPRG